MPTMIRVVVAGLVALALSGGINWKTVWLEPNPVVLHAGSSISYVVKGINGVDLKADLTYSPHLVIRSSDTKVVEVDQKHARLVGKSSGRAEIRISFSECTSLVEATVLDHPAPTSSN